VNHHPLISYLCEHGTSESNLVWFHENAVSFDIFGANFYPWSYRELKKQSDGSLHHTPVPTGGEIISLVIRETYKRYRAPILVTETSAKRDIPGRRQWLDETLQAVRELRIAGIPVLGYTWFPLFTMVDWTYRTGEGTVDDYLIHLGLYDSAFDEEGTLIRHKTALVEHYQDLMKQPMPEIGYS
jgi:hypothetical protein